MARTEAIFIHSLFRAASAYFFSKFRSSDPRFVCYQEPFNESLVALNDPARHGRLLESPNGSRQLRHPRLDRPYFYEFWARRAQLAGLYHESFAYQQYFPGESEQLPAAQLAWLSALIRHADGIPVLQLCRSSGRVAAIRQAYYGMHLHLWREPRTQWWSYKVAPYFDIATRKIYAACHLPGALRQIRALTDPGMARQHLRPCDNYRLFYGLWLDGWLRLQSHAELSICLDDLMVGLERQRECSRQLSELVGSAIDLSDMRASGMAFAAEEEPFYAEVERSVHDVFMRTGRATARGVQAAREAACGARAVHQRIGHDAAAERNVRLVALTMMQQLADQEGGQSQWSVRRLGTWLRGRWRALWQTSAPRGDAAGGQAPVVTEDIG